MAKAIGFLSFLCFLLACASLSVAAGQETTLPQGKTVKIKDVRKLQLQPTAQKYIPVKKAGSNVIQFIPENEIAPDDQPVTVKMLPGYATPPEEYIERLSNLEQEVSDLKALVSTQTMVIEYLKKELDNFTEDQGGAGN